MKKILVENQTAAFEILELRGQMGVFEIINGLQYLAIPFIYLWKFTVISFVIWIGCFMFGYKISFYDCWHMALVCEIVFFIPELLKIIWFMFFVNEPDIFDIKVFYPFSLVNFFDPHELHARWLYPLKALNIFEVVYWFLLVKALNHKINKKLSTAYAIILSSYVLFFFLWLGFYLLIYK